MGILGSEGGGMLLILPRQATSRIIKLAIGQLSVPEHASTSTHGVNGSKRTECDDPQKAASRYEPLCAAERNLTIAT